MTWITLPTIFGPSPWFIADLNADFAAIVNALNTFNPSGALFAQNGVSTVRGLVGQNDPVAPTTKYGYGVAFVVLRDPATGGLFSQDTVVTSTNDTGLAGPIVDGRDQAGAFAASSWVHFYYIANPTTFSVATLSSATPPPVGPTLPTGFTSWAYVGAVRMDGAGLLVQTLLRGAQAFYEDQIVVVNTSAPAINTETPVSISGEIPPNALSVTLTATIGVTNGAASSGFELDFRTTSGVVAARLRGVVNAGATNAGQMQVVLANVSQTYLYLWSVDSPSAPALVETQQWVNGYRIPNGDA